MTPLFIDLGPWGPILLAFVGIGFWVVGLLLIELLRRRWTGDD